MPIRPEQRALYPRDWRSITARIRERAGNACECTGQCGDPHEGRCAAPNGAGIVRHVEQPWLYLTAEQWLASGRGCEDLDDEYEARAIKVVLTVAHYPDPDPRNCADDNLLALCQRCHLKLDAPQHAANARATRRARKAIGELPGLDDALAPGGGR